MAIFSLGAALVSGISSFIGGLGALGTFALRTAVGIGLSLAAQALAGKEKPPGFSFTGTLQGGGDLSRSFIIGRYATGGSLVWANTWGNADSTPNAWLTQVIALSDLPISGVSGVIVDGKTVTFDYAQAVSQPYGYQVPEYNNNGANLLIKIYDGTQTTADPILIGNASAGSDRPWTSAHVGKGVAYAIIHARATRNMFQGTPTLKFVVDGLKLYNPALDSTVGGSGSHLWSDPSTWGGWGDLNPVVQNYNLLRGISYGGKWFYGFQGMSSARLPVADWIAQINKAQVPIAEAGGNVPTYRCAGEIIVDAPLSTALEAVNTSCQGSITEVGGFYFMRFGAPDAAVANFHDDDILSNREQSFTPFYGIADTINGISGSYPSAADNWNMRTAPPIIRPDLEAKDGNRRLMASVDFDFVPYDEQVQRLMKSALLAALRWRRHTITLPPSYWAYAVPGNYVAWTSPRNGYVDKLFKIEGAVDRSNLEVVVDISEVDPSDYAWSSGAEFQPQIPSRYGPIVPPANRPRTFNAQPYTILDDTGTPRRAGLRLTWDNSHEKLIDVRGVEYQIKDKATQAMYIKGVDEAPEDGEFITESASNVLYQVRMRFVSLSGNTAQDWTDWLDVLSPTVLMGSKDIYNDGDVEQIREIVADATEWMRDGIRNTMLDIQKEATSSIDNEFGTYDERRKIGLGVASDIGAARAEAQFNLEAATGPNSALARAQLRVDASLAGKASASAVDTLTATVTTQGTSISAVSGRVSTLEAKVPGLATVTALDATNVRVTAAEGNISAQATKINKLEVDMGGKANASATNALNVNVTQINGKMTTMAEAITSISAGQTAGDVSTANMRMQVYGSPGAGFLSRIGLEARAGGAGSYRAAALYMDVPDNTSAPTRIVMLADQIVMTDNGGGGSRNPFIFEGGVLTLNAARVKEVTAGLIRSTNNKMRIDLDLGTIEVYS